MKTHRTPAMLVLLALLLQPGARVAATESEPPGAEAAALEDQATTLEAAIDKECQKVAKQARPLCREQHQQAVQRLRSRAARLR